MMMLIILLVTEQRLATYAKIVQKVYIEWVLVKYF